MRCLAAPRMYARNVPVGLWEWCDCAMQLGKGAECELVELRAKVQHNDQVIAELRSHAADPQARALNFAAFSCDYSVVIQICMVWP